MKSSLEVSGLRVAFDSNLDPLVALDTRKFCWKPSRSNPIHGTCAGKGRTSCSAN